MSAPGPDQSPELSATSGGRKPRATVDTRPLFSWLRHVAYDEHQDFDDLDGFTTHLTALALDWLDQHGRPTSGGPRPSEWTAADQRKVSREAEKIATWTWERMSVTRQE